MKRIILLALSLLPFALSAQTITTVVGTGVSGDTGDGGPATAATLHLPQGIARDTAGNLYITNHDHANHRVRKINSAGIYTIIAGTGVGGYSGDGGPATAAQVWDPLGMCVDKYGNLYIAEEINSVIRKINTAGIISTVAGNGTPGYSGDGGAATNARLQDPQSVKVDTAGNLYITDYGNHVVRKVSAAGIITTFAGNNALAPGYSGDGGPATAAQMELPADIAIDKTGNIYITDYAHHVIRKVGTNDTITTFSGLSGGGFAGDGGPATSARFYAPWGIEFDSSGNLLIVDTKNDRIRKINTAGIVSTIAGDGTNSMGSAPWGAYGGDTGPATAGKLYWPAHIVIGAAGSFYFTDQSNNAVRMVDTSKPKHYTLTTHNLNTSGSDITILPNPNNGAFLIKGTLSGRVDETISVDVRNMIGQVVYHSDVTVQNGLFNKSILLDKDLPPGMYLIHMRSEGTNSVSHFELRK